MTLDDLVIDDTTGDVLAIGGQPIRDWRLELWRAPTDNDRGRGWNEPHQPSYADRWSALGLDRLVSRLVDLERSADRVVVTTHVGGAGLDAAVSCTWTWTAGAHGLDLDLDVVPTADRKSVV